MSRKEKDSAKSRVDDGSKNSKKDKKDKKIKKDGKKPKQASDVKSEKSNGLSLLADEQNVDSTLSSLFATKQLRTPTVTNATGSAVRAHKSAEAKYQVEQDATNDIPSDHEREAVADSSALDEHRPTATKSTRKRKRGDAEDDLEDKYMRKLAKQADRELQIESKAALDTVGTRAARSRPIKPLSVEEDEEGSTSAPEIIEEDADDVQNDSSEGSWVPPKHETETTASDEVDKANRTVFLGNVSVIAITSKSARKLLEQHLMSFAKAVNNTSETRILESIRFRSTPYSPTLPKKAAFARKEVITATTQSTNAYAVYTTQAHAREAARRLNGSVILDRHLRVDQVAHPAAVEHRRCVFVGNLGFVDDETNIVAANEADGREKRKTKQKPSDIEEGLWRLFGKHGTVESVRVIRDKGTRVGKGIAYVQFTDEIAVEGALSEDGKKDPPRLPRRLRVTRAKAMKKKAASVPRADGKENGLGYRRKVTPGEATQKGRIGKLMGKAAAALATKPTSFRSPESVIFEGHRAKAVQGTKGLKLGKVVKKKGKPTTRSARRAATFRASGQKRPS